MIEVAGLALAEDQLLNLPSYWRVIDLITPLRYHVGGLVVLNARIVYSLGATKQSHEEHLSPMATRKTEI